LEPSPSCLYVFIPTVSHLCLTFLWSPSSLHDECLFLEGWVSVIRRLSDVPRRIFSTEFEASSGATYHIDETGDGIPYTVSHLSFQ